MRCAGLLCGGSPIIKRYQVSETIAKAGVIMNGSTTTTTGLIKGTTTALVGMVGLAVDTVTYSTTQLGAGAGGGGSKGAGGSAGGGVPASASAYLGVIINPDIMIASRLCQGATSGTAVTSRTNTSASTGGLVHTAAVGSNTYVNGTVWDLTGNNAGDSRIITSWSSNTSVTNIVPFDYTIAVNDTFACVPYQPFGGVNLALTMQFTTDMTESDMSIAVGTGATGIVVLDLFLRDASLDGVNDSWVVFNASTAHQLYQAAGV